MGITTFIGKKRPSANTMPKVTKGAVVKNSVLFRGTYVESGAELNCIVTDKDVHVTEGVKLSGNKNMPFYIQKGRKI